MNSIIECVPNFSEGKDLTVIQDIAEAIQQDRTVKLLHVDTGHTAHRTVMTFAGAPDAVVEAAFRAIQVASMRIDMRQHTGIHPRMGATDVCPLIPIHDISMQEVIMWAHKLAHRVGQTLNIPVYLYEAAATAPHRKNLAHIRQGEYEGFQSKIQLPEWFPDYGPAVFQPNVGQTVIGARDFLVAYNINLDTTDVHIAKEIAADIRESGRIKKENGIIVKDETGKPLRNPGACKFVKAIGWYVEEFQCAQVSTNLTHIRQTPPHVAFEAVKTAAARHGVSVTGSELVGLIPKDCLLEAAHFYASDANYYLEEKAAIDLAIEKLGLSQLRPFNPQERILEYLI